MNKKLISIALPCYNESDNIKPIFDAIIDVIPKTYDYEIVMVNDGSTDNTEEIFENLAKLPNFKGITLYRNFGHQAAILCAISFCAGDAIITMDADFQHPPEKIPDLIDKWEQGYDLIVCQKATYDNRNYFISLLRKIGYFIYMYAGENKLIPGVSDFRLMDKAVAVNIKNTSESRFVLRGLVMLYARKVFVTPYIVAKRRSGKPKMNFVKLYILFVNSIISFSIIPLRIATQIGILLILFSFLYVGYVIYKKLVFGTSIIEGFTTTIFILTTLFGFLFFYLGVLSEYIGAIFDEVKKRPKYIINKTYNVPEAV